MKNAMHYQKKGQYILHPDLILYKESGWGFQIKFNVILLSILAICRIYPSWLMSFDFTLGILIVLFWLIGKPVMLKGKLPFSVYYRKMYENNYFLFFSKLFIHGSVVKAVTISAYFVFKAVLVQGNVNELGFLSHQFVSFLLQPKAQMTAFVVFSIFFIAFFRQGKYVEISHYSRKIVDLMKHRNFTLEQANLFFIGERDFWLEQEAVEGIKYDQREQVIKETVKNNSQTSTNDLPSNSENSATSFLTPVRRQSRR